MSIYFLGLEMNPEEFAKLIIRYLVNPWEHFPSKNISIKFDGGLIL